MKQRQKAIAADQVPKQPENFRVRVGIGPGPHPFTVRNQNVTEEDLRREKIRAETIDVDELKEEFGVHIAPPPARAQRKKKTGSDSDFESDDSGNKERRARPPRMSEQLEATGKRIVTKKMTEGYPVGGVMDESDTAAGMLRIGKGSHHPTATSEEM